MGVWIYYVRLSYQFSFSFFCRFLNSPISIFFGNDFFGLNLTLPLFFSPPPFVITRSHFKVAKINRNLNENSGFGTNVARGGHWPRHGHRTSLDRTKLDLLIFRHHRSSAAARFGTPVIKVNRPGCRLFFETF